MTRSDFRFSSGCVSWIFRPHCGQHLLLWRYFTTQLLQTATKPHGCCQVIPVCHLKSIIVKSYKLSTFLASLAYCVTFPTIFIFNSMHKLMQTARTISLAFFQLVQTSKGFNKLNFHQECTNGQTRIHCVVWTLNIRQPAMAALSDNVQDKASYTYEGILWLLWHQWSSQHTENTLCVY